MMTQVGAHAITENCCYLCIQYHVYNRFLSNCLIDFLQHQKSDIKSTLDFEAGIIYF